MPRSLSQTQACTEMAEILASFLPGSGSPQWTGHVTFATVARDLGLEAFWSGGSKTRAVAMLLDQTLEQRRSVFERLLQAIVREGLHYRQKNGNPVTRDEIMRLNSLLRRVHFQFPWLLDAAFLERLPSSGTRASAPRDATAESQSPPATSAATTHQQLEVLRNRFYQLSGFTDRQHAGREFERLLNDLFALHSLAPRTPFRLCGEQIDGSFELDNHTYLVEAKWEQQHTPTAQLLIFQEKVQAKSTFTRGVFVTVSGLSGEAANGFTRGRRPSFVVVDGYDLTVVLEGQVSLNVLLRAKLRRLAEEGQIFVSVRDLLS